MIILVKFETNLTLYIQGRYKILIRNIANFANIIKVFEQSTITYYTYMVCTCEETMYVKNVYLQLSLISWYCLTMILIYVHEIISLIFLLFLLNIRSFIKFCGLLINDFGLPFIYILLQLSFVFHSSAIL